MERTGYEVYELYLRPYQEEIKNATPFALEIRSTSDYRRLVVRARVARSKEQLTNPEPLWVREEKWEQIQGEPLWIEILEELDEDTVLERPEASPEGIKAYGSS